MQIKDFLAANHVYICRNMPSKKRVLDFISEQLAGITGIEQSVLLHEFVARERLGSTALGNSVAVPHIRLKEIEKAISIFLLLIPGLNFESPDQKNVDLVFGLIVPDDETSQHLQIYSQIAWLFHEEEFRNKIRQCRSTEQIYHLLTHPVYGIQ